MDVLIVLIMVVKGLVYSLYGLIEWVRSLKLGIVLIKIDGKSEFKNVVNG